MNLPHSIVLLLCVLIAGLLAGLLTQALVGRARATRLAQQRRRAWIAEHRRVVRLQAEHEALLRVLVPARRTLLVGPYLPEPTRAWIMGILGYVGAERAATVPELERIWQRRGFAYVDARLNPEAYALFAATFGHESTPAPHRPTATAPRWVRPEEAVPGSFLARGVPVDPVRSQPTPAPSRLPGERAPAPPPSPAPPAPPPPHFWLAQHHWDGLMNDTEVSFPDTDRDELRRLLARAEQELHDVEPPACGPLTLAGV